MIVPETTKSILARPSIVPAWDTQETTEILTVYWTIAI